MVKTISEQELLEAKIMVVDDDPMIVMLIEEALQSAGYMTIKSTNDPREASSLYMDFQPDLVLLDINMPHMSGYRVMEKLKEIEDSGYLPVLVLTAQEDREAKVKALESGAKDFINKPFDLAETLSRIRNLLEVRLLHNKVKNQNVILEEKVRDRTKELHDTRLEIIRRLGIAAEYRDEDTGTHIIRMSKMSALLGKAAGMPEREVDILLNASPMHDVGKIGIPDSILLKPGKLTQEERKIMETHATIGGQILSGNPSELMNMAREIALTHHEKWDGSGYPEGIRGENIPLTGRICAVSDVFDALTTKRPYKEAWSVEKAVALIKQNRGTQFDPDLVDLFESILPEIMEIKEQYVER